MSVLRKCGVSEKYVRQVHDMYEDNRTMVTCAARVTDTVAESPP